MSLEWLKHAFAIEPAGAVEPTEGQQAAVDRLCRQVVTRGLTTPALLFLETVRPLNYVTGQTLRFFGPIMSAVGDSWSTDEFASFLERRGSIDYLCRRIEELDRKKSQESAPNVESNEPSSA